MIEFLVTLLVIAALNPEWVFIVCLFVIGFLVRRWPSEDR